MRHVLCLYHCLLYPTRKHILRKIKSHLENNNNAILCKQTTEMLTISVTPKVPTPLFLKLTVFGITLLSTVHSYG